MGFVCVAPRMNAITAAAAAAAVIALCCGAGAVGSLRAGSGSGSGDAIQGRVRREACWGIIIMQVQVLYTGGVGVDVCVSWSLPGRRRGGDCCL